MTEWQQIHYAQTPRPGTALCCFHAVAVVRGQRRIVLDGRVGAQAAKNDYGGAGCRRRPRQYVIHRPAHDRIVLRIRWNADWHHDRPTRDGPLLSTIGILMICYYSEAAVSAREIVTRILTFPPLIALVVAAALIPFSYPTWIISCTEPLGRVLPLWPWSRLGCNYVWGPCAATAARLPWGLGYKLGPAPSLVALV